MNNVEEFKGTEDELRQQGFMYYDEVIYAYPDNDILCISGKLPDIGEMYKPVEIFTSTDMGNRQSIYRSYFEKYEVVVLEGINKQKRSIRFSY